MAILTAALVAGCGNSKSNSGKKAPVAKPPVIVADLQLQVDENTQSFNKQKLIAAQPGTVKITVTNPKTAKGQHGVGITGGQYKNIMGAPVKPGRSTSLTVDLKAGQYVIFDSYGKNGKKGYTVNLTVKKGPKK